MKKLLAVVALFLFCFVAAADPTTNAPSVTLAWDVSNDLSVSGYRVYWGVASRQYTNFVAVAGRTNSTAVVPNLARNTLYYFAATCTATNGLESDFSAQVTYQTLPIPPVPTGLTIRVLNP